MNSNNKDCNCSTFLYLQSISDALHFGWLNCFCFLPPAYLLFTVISWAVAQAPIPQQASIPPRVTRQCELPLPTGATSTLLTWDAPAEERDREVSYQEILARTVYHASRHWDKGCIS